MAAYLSFQLSDRPMETLDKPPKKVRSFSFYLIFSMVILILCIVGFLTINDYLYTKQNYDREVHLLQVQTEQNIQGAMRLKDTTWNIFDDSLNEKMNAGLSSVLLEYKRAGGDPAAMDLAAVKTDLGSDYDIYIIDENGVIIQTTYGPELGMDFKTIPYFFDYLTRIRGMDGFFPDRVVHELKGIGKFRKYAYMPTPDHRYVLELGLAGQYFDQVNQQLDDRGTIEQIVSVNPYVENFRIFNSMGRNIGDNRLPEESVQVHIARTFKNRSDIEVEDPANARTTRYLFVDLKNDKYGSDPSRIVEITYNTMRINDSLNRLILFHLLVGVCATLLGCLIVVLMSRRITRPVQDIVNDADRIAHGDLDHRIRSSQSSEFAILGTSINSMVDSLKSASRKMKDDEIFQKEMITQLPVGVFIKRAGDGRYVFWNTACEQLFHLPASRVLGKNDRELFPADMVVTIEKEDRQFSLNRAELCNKVLSNKYLGDQVIHLIIVPIFDSTGTLLYIMGIADDVSYENVNLKMDLLFSITRHDILDNLSVIMNHLERAQLKNTHEDLQTFFNKTIVSIESIRNQISSMRELQELGLISPKWQPVKQVFNDAAKLLPDHSVEIRADMDDIEIFADPLLPRVFYMLLEANLRSGRLHVSHIRLTAFKENRTLHLIYTDDSDGIPAAEKEKIFEIGYDSGLYRGLFLIRELLSFTRLTIVENGEPGRGIRFEIIIPEDKFRYMK
jgi:signal transduction histidine kinase/HAMP domain-containing protein